MDVPRPAPVTPIAERLRAWLAWFGVGKLVTTAGSILIIASGSWWLLHAPPPPVERSLPYAAGAGSTAASVATSAPAGVKALADDSASTSAVVAVPSMIIVQVAGAVVYPGVFTLPRGARIHQLIEAAGGATAEGDPGALNLAVALSDGDRVFVPRQGDATEPPVVASNAGSSSAPRVAVPGATGSGGGDSTVATGPIDLNRATQSELDALPGVGPATALAIVSFRDEHGPFAAIDDLLDVRGIGPAKLDAIRPMVIV